MSREWCLIVHPTDRATEDERQTIGLVFELREPPFDFERDGDEVLVYGDPSHSIARLEKAVLHALAQSGVADVVDLPLPVGRRESEDDPYTWSRVLDDGTTAPALVVEPDQITWVASVSPIAFTGWRDLRSGLRQRGRLILSEDDHSLEVGARDEPDARALLDQLRAAALIRTGSTRRIGRFRRWRIREQYLGNYTGPSDPTNPAQTGYVP